MESTWSCLWTLSPLQTHSCRLTSRAPAQPAAPDDSRQEPRPNLKRCHGVRAQPGMPGGRRQGWGLRVRAVCSQEAGARLQGPLRRLLPLIQPPLAPKNNILVCLLGALRDRDRLFIPAISMRPYSGRLAPGPRPASRHRPSQAALRPFCAGRPISGFEPLLRPNAWVLNW